ncbi:hypothetical protein FH972_008726 [Carpinus fangiana]|uniref:Uncharacterized protein n=1 Tax=Carpinus fangiana TaxID=176857 RepID=A0A5N6QZN2_9ROSI|nr:hypothetical protein FH972_008726 [Carpinus fangiana]
MSQAAPHHESWATSPHGWHPVPRATPYWAPKPHTTAHPVNKSSTNAWLDCTTCHSSNKASTRLLKDLCHVQAQPANLLLSLGHVQHLILAQGMPPSCLDLVVSKGVRQTLVVTIDTHVTTVTLPIPADWKRKKYKHPNSPTSCTSFSFASEESLGSGFALLNVAPSARSCPFATIMLHIIPTAFSLQPNVSLDKSFKLRPS